MASEYLEKFGECGRFHMMLPSERNLLELQLTLEPNGDSGILTT